MFWYNSNDVPKNVNKAIRFDFKGLRFSIVNNNLSLN